MLIRALFFAVLALPAYAQELRVVDGDTLVLNDKTIRINGIDAPEHGQKCGPWDCGKAATEALAGLVEDGKIECETHGTDSYGRLISTCYVGGKDIGQTLVDNGVAWAFTKYSDVYSQEQLNAKARKLGIWSGPSDYQSPWAYREARWNDADQQAPEGCPIKGNISRNGKIYHAPWSPWYSRTKINTAKGERWFCSEGEALEAGWRAPLWW